MSSLTENIRKACKCFVSEHLPHELSMFDDVWHAYIHALEFDGEELPRHGLAIVENDKPVDVLGAMGGVGQQIDTVFVLGYVMTAMIDQNRENPKAEITSQTISDHLRKTIEQFKIPAHLHSILYAHAVPLVAGLLEVECEQEQRIKPVTYDHRLWAEWYHPDLTPKSDYDFYEPAEIDKQIYQQHEQFELIADETKHGLLLPQINKEVLWNDLQPRQRLLLGLIFKALQIGEPISYVDIHQQVLSKLGIPTDVDCTNIRRTKSELDAKLHGIFKEVIVADRGLQQYFVNRRIAYCWIRTAGGNSRLLRESP